jgi:tight adherence protein C
MQEYLIGFLVFVTVLSIGGALLLRRAAQRGAMRARLHGEGRTDLSRESGARQGFLQTLGSLGQRVSSGKTSASLGEELAKAGFRDKSAPAIYLGVKVTMLVVGVAAVAILVLSSGLPMTSKIVLPLVVGGIFFFLPNLVVTWRQRRRSDEVRCCLPDAIDLLEICLSSGMSLDAAWNLVAAEIRHVGQYLADEMALVDLEIHLGASREEAMRHMAKRTDAAALSSLVAVLVQSERFGTGVAEALRSFAEALREDRAFRAEEAGEKVAVKLLFPLVLFLFPAIFIVLAGPAFLTLFKMILSS